MSALLVLAGFVPGGSMESLFMEDAATAFAALALIEAERAGSK
jgi:hypothetical protein